MAVLSTWQFWMMFGGGCGATLCILWIYKTKQFLKAATRANGEVRELVCDTDSKGERYYRPRFIFQTPDGEPWSVQSHTGSNPSAFKVGEKVTVVYDPGRPADAQIDSVSQLWLLPAVFLAVSIILVLTGVCRLVLDR